MGFSCQPCYRRHHVQPTATCVRLRRASLPSWESEDVRSVVSSALHGPESVEDQSQSFPNSLKDCYLESGCSVPAASGRATRMNERRVSGKGGLIWVVTLICLHDRMISIKGIPECQEQYTVHKVWQLHVILTCQL